MQVRAPGTPLIPTRKTVDFLGIRAGEVNGGAVVHQPGNSVISIAITCVRQNPARQVMLDVSNEWLTFVRHKSRYRY